jgi:hypothetical protein
MTISRPRRREKKLRRKGDRKKTGQRRKLRRLHKWFKRWQKKTLMLYRNLWVRHWSTLGNMDNGRDIENKLLILILGNKWNGYWLQAQTVLLQMELEKSISRVSHFLIVQLRCNFNRIFTWPLFSGWVAYRTEVKIYQ